MSHKIKIVDEVREVKTRYDVVTGVQTCALPICSEIKLGSVSMSLRMQLVRVDCLKFEQELFELSSEFSTKF